MLDPDTISGRLGMRSFAAFAFAFLKATIDVPIDISRRSKSSTDSAVDDDKQGLPLR
jgi:hypothetical protein